MVLPAQDKATSPAGEPETEGFEFRAWRIEHGIAEGDTEMTSGEQACILCCASCCVHAAQAVTYVLLHCYYQGCMIFIVGGMVLAMLEQPERLIGVRQVNAHVLCSADPEQA